jgi:hypothetical protein
MGASRQEIDEYRQVQNTNRQHEAINFTAGRAVTPMPGPVLTQRDLHGRRYLNRRRSCKLHVTRWLTRPTARIVLGAPLSGLLSPYGLRRQFPASPPSPVMGRPFPWRVGRRITEML